MKISVEAGKYSSFKSELIAVPVTEEKVKELMKGTNSTEKKLHELILLEGFKGETGKVLYIHSMNLIEAKRLLLVGVGKQKSLNSEELRRFASTAVSFAKKLKVQDFAVACHEGQEFNEMDACFALTEGIFLSDYDFDKYKTEAKKDSKPLISATLLVHEKEAAKKAEEGIAKAVTLCRGTNLVRDLGNENSSIITPKKLAELALDLGRKHKMKVTVFDEKKLRELKMELISAVGIGSVNPPRMVFIEYNGDPRSKERIAVIGKGITFDTGGYNLKPTGMIETMKMDMSGAANVLGIMNVLAELKVKKNVVGVMACAENAVSDRAYKPGDVFTSYSGLTVEIGNTDAEGRLVLADALSFTEKNYKPDLIVDLATLTGAIMISLGSEVIGLFSDEEFYVNQMYESGLITFERVWELPIYEEFKEGIKSEFADLKNTGFPKGFASSITAALFLKSFCPKTPWIHLDIAGVDWIDAPKYYKPKGATGVGLRLMAHFIENLEFKKKSKTGKSD